jgi:hypothetical protein
MRACLFRNKGEPVLNLKNPPGIPMNLQRKGLDTLMELNQSRYDQFKRSRDRQPHRRV